VPTGNFGNVLAGWLVQKMGVPFAGFRVATNRNDILYRLFTTGDYSVSTVHPSHAPSMDIQVASNFERFLYFAEDRNPARVREVMAEFKRTGRYRFTNFNRDSFSASRTDDSEIAGIIRDVHQRYGYVVDPHTACGFKDLPKDRPSVVLSTAHPAKFPDVIRQSIGSEATHPTLEALKSRPLVKHKIPATVKAVKEFIESHR
jgi:threonine synthase